MVGPFLQPFLQGPFLHGFCSSEKEKNGDTHGFQKNNFFYLMTKISDYEFFGVMFYKREKYYLIFVFMRKTQLEFYRK